MEIAIVYIPCPHITEAEKLAIILLNDKLIACSNIVDSKSLYFWEAQINQEFECVMIGKTLPTMLKSIENTVLKNHPYEIPAIISWKANCNDAYFQWVKAQLK